MSPRSRVRIGAAAALAVAALAGCGGPGRQRVEIRDVAFVPAQLSVADGGEVVFVNHDAIPHTATATDGSWDSGNIAAGDSVVVHVKRAGPYKCSYHPTMTGTLAGSK